MLKLGIFGFGAVGMSIYNELNRYKELYVLVDDKRYDKYINKELIINNKKYHPNYIKEGIMDVIILTVKNYDLINALNDIKPFVSNDTVFLPLLNGIEAHDIIQSYFKSNKVLYGVINVD